jgi:mRNA-degrading endonuclease HigB of HigAB toxin-antitoxin module
MRVISKKRLRDFWEILPAAKTSLEQWHKVVNEANWLHFAELRNTFNHADLATTDQGHPVVSSTWGATSTASLPRFITTETSVTSSAF